MTTQHHVTNDDAHTELDVDYMDIYMDADGWWYIDIWSSGISSGGKSIYMCNMVFINRYATLKSIDRKMKDSRARPVSQKQLKIGTNKRNLNAIE